MGCVPSWAAAGLAEPVKGAGAGGQFGLNAKRVALVCPAGLELRFKASGGGAGGGPKFCRGDLSALMCCGGNVKGAGGLAGSAGGVVVGRACGKEGCEAKGGFHVFSVGGRKLQFSTAQSLFLGFRSWRGKGKFVLAGHYGKHCRNLENVNDVYASGLAGGLELLCCDVLYALVRLRVEMCGQLLACGRRGNVPVLRRG